MRNYGATCSTILRTGQRLASDYTRCPRTACRPARAEQSVQGFGCRRVSALTALAFAHNLALSMYESATLGDLGALRASHRTIWAQSREVLQLTSVLGSPAFSKRLPIVPVLSSEARRPFPGAASCAATCASDEAILTIDAAQNCCTQRSDFKCGVSAHIKGCGRR